MQPSPGTQLKINQFLRALPPARELDSDCFIVEPADRKGNQCSNAPADSKVVDPATPRRHPKINDVDDDDELMIEKGEELKSLLDLNFVVLRNN